MSRLRRGRCLLRNSESSRDMTITCILLLDTLHLEDKLLFLPGIISIARKRSNLSLSATNYFLSAKTM